MSDFHVAIPDLPPFVAKMRHAPAIVGEEMGKAGKRVGILVEHGAKGYAPVKTGTLRRSITNTVTVSPMVTNVKVGTNVPYAKYVEFGRGPVHARPGGFLRFEIGGRVIYARSVGPARAKPFLYRAFNALRGRITAEFRRVPAAVIARLR